MIPPDDLEELAYLWDGSQPGWELHWTDRVVWVVTVYLAGGSTPSEVSRLRKLIPSLGAMTATEAYRAVAGEPSILYPGELGQIEKRQVLERAAALGFRVTVESRDRSGGLPVRNGFAVLIEDDDLMRRVCDKMRESGCPVIYSHAD